MFNQPGALRSAINQQFAERCSWDEPLSQHTTAQVGGNASVFIKAINRQGLIQAVRFCWMHNLQLKILGAGSNILVSENGFDGVVILNQARAIKVVENSQPPSIYAESGANLGMVARKAGLAGISGLEWAATVPGTVGGAVYGNAGAHGSDMQSNLTVVEILQPESDPLQWTVEQLQYEYRSSILKRTQSGHVILSASFHGLADDPNKIKERMQTFSSHRKNTQPPGASMGSIFKNPEGDFAGRLIEQAGLKGFSIGGVLVSPIHANFFVNTRNASSQDYWQLIQHVRATVYQKFNINLELEVEPVGFSDDSLSTSTPYSAGAQHD